MKLTIIAFTFLFAMGAFAQKATTINDFAGLAGCWESSDGKKDRTVSEQWMSPLGTSILGMGRTVQKSKTVDFEFMRIEQRADGIYFVAQPKQNKEETAFKLISTTASEFTFENKEHDFPQRVIYKLQGEKMIGRIEGTMNGKERGIDFPYIKVKCG